MRVPILCYHKIGDAGGRSLNVAETDFLRQVAFLRRRYTFHRLDEWPGLRGGSETPSPSSEGEGWGGGAPDRRRRRSVILTFDDAYTSTAEVLLRAPGLTGTVFPVPSLVGRASEWDGDAARPLADWEVLAALRDAGFELANHTLTHADLSAEVVPENPHPTLPLWKRGWEDPSHPLETRGAGRAPETRDPKPDTPHPIPDTPDDPTAREIAAAADAIRERLGVETRTFCYPYGRFDERAVAALRERGYLAAVTTRTCIADTKGDPLRLPRLKIGYSDRLAGLLYKLYIRPLLP